MRWADLQFQDKYRLARNTYQSTRELQVIQLVV